MCEFIRSDFIILEVPYSFGEIRKNTNIIISTPQPYTQYHGIAIHRHSGSVVERPLCDREVAGSIPGRVIPKTLKMVLAALSLGAQH